MILVEELKSSGIPPVVIDVRTGEEYKRGHIPGAFNIPLLNETERAEIGILYKKSGRERAVERGLEIVSPKLPSIYIAAKNVRDSSPQDEIKIIIYCWRGGLRSKFVANILNFMGLSCDTLDGGYKKYRTCVLSQFEKTKPSNLLVVDGLTGTGKTVLLNFLKNKGFPVIDLEGLASHKGSVFGDVATPPQPTQQQFENALAEELSNIECTSPILIEGESKRIGFIQIPKPFFDSMTKAQRIFVEDSLENRVERIYKDYIEPIPVKTLLDRLSKLQKYLGPNRYSSLQSDLLEGRVVKFVEGILTQYYDPAYKRCFQKRITEGEVVSVLPADGDRIIEWLGSQNWSNVADAQPN